METFISEPFLNQLGFIKTLDGTFLLELKIANQTLLIHVDIIAPGIAVMVGVKDIRSPFYCVLPIHNERQLLKLVTAVQGK